MKYCWRHVNPCQTKKQVNVWEKYLVRSLFQYKCCKEKCWWMNVPFDCLFFSLSTIDWLLFISFFCVLNCEPRISRWIWVLYKKTHIRKRNMKKYILTFWCTNICPRNVQVFVSQFMSHWVIVEKFLKYSRWCLLPVWECTESDYERERLVRCSGML